VAAGITEGRAHTEGTHQKQAAYWEKWILYLHSIELENDPFLQQLEPALRTTIVTAFGAAYRDNRFTKRGLTPPKADTVGAALDAVAKTFRENNIESPIHEANGTKCIQVRQLLRGFRNQDPSTKHQKAIPMSMLQHAALRQQNTQEESALSELFRGAIFFAMRSCEYLEVTGGERRTKKLRLRNLRFFIGRRELPLTSPDLHRADTVSINFEYQKNDIRDDIITQHSNKSPLLNPVVAWATIVRRVLSYPNTNLDSAVNLVLREDGKPHLITSQSALLYIRKLTKELGKDTLGFEPSDVGVHSIRSGGAMGMYLGNIPVYTIMLLGRWSSDAFLLYIRKQVQEFSAGVSQRMIIHEQFFTVPDHTSGLEDPRSHSGLHISGRGLQNGLTPQSFAAQPAFSAIS